MTAPEGLARGASKAVVYDGERLVPALPTRLFVDAQSTSEWRTKGFYSILDEAPDRNLVRLMLDLGAAHTFKAGEKLPDDVPVGIDHTFGSFTGIVLRHSLDADEVPQLRARFGQQSVYNVFRNTGSGALPVHVG